MYGSETVVSSFFVSVFVHTLQYVILFVMFVFVGVNKFVTVIVVKYLA